MVSHARSCPRGILALSLFVFCLIQLATAVTADARVEFKIETSLEGDPGDGVLSPSAGSGSTSRQFADDTSPVTVAEPVITPALAPFRWPFVFSATPGVPGSLLWFDGWALPVRDLWEGRWPYASRSHH